MENFYFIGVDVSKKKLDFCVMFEGKVVHEEETTNHQSWHCCINWKKTMV